MRMVVLLICAVNTAVTMRVAQGEWFLVLPSKFGDGLMRVDRLSCVLMITSKTSLII